jgi:predicted glutamine amidotransferase
MCRLLGWVARDGLSLWDVLGEESFVAFAQLSRIHADGWGLAYEAGDGVAVERSTTNASADPGFTEVATDVATRAGLAHLRWASPGLPVELCNAHPFRWGNTAFAHNGGIYPLDRVGELLTAPWRDRLGGTTDSEHYFLAVMAEMADSGSDLPTALGRVLARLTDEYAPSSLNSIFLAPEALYVVNCHDASIKPELPPLEPRSVDQMLEETEEEVPYYDLRYRRTGDAVVVASSGFAQPEGGGWRRMENNSLLVVGRATLEVTEVALDVRIGRGAATDTADAPVR